MTSPGYESEPSQQAVHGISTGRASGPLHVNPYPNTASPGQTRECSAGNEPYPNKAVLGNPAGQRRDQDREDDAERLMRRHQPRVSNFVAGAHRRPS